ncbi:hypothetical protein E2320_007656, partial [Naja naja]
MDSLSSQSPTTAAPTSPQDTEKNNLITDSGTPSSEVHSSMVSWINLKSTTAQSPVTTNLSFLFPSSATETDRPVGRKARAVYPCEAEHSSELSFQTGAVFEDVHLSREPGWLEGTLNGKRGLIPQNYV